MISSCWMEGNIHLERMLSTKLSSFAIENLEFGADCLIILQEKEGYDFEMC